MIKKINSLLLFLLFFTIVICVPKNTGAQVKDYYYENFSVDIQINQDSTFDVTETQIYRLNGNFGFFYRDIERKKLDHFSDIQTLDKNGNPLPTSQIEKSWQGNAQRIQWNFPRRDFNNELLTWQVKYKVHGGLDFYGERDELYWNTIPAAGRDKEIKNLTVTVHLPENFSQNDFETSIYSETKPGTYAFIDENTVRYQTTNLPPYANYTIAVDWPTGWINKPDFYREQLLNYIFAAIAGIILIGGISWILLRWRKVGKDPKADKTIIAKYTPPENLSPAAVELLVNQALSKALPATIIDLARRGYFRIKEEPMDLWGINLAKDYKIERMKEADSALLPHEQAAYSLLFPSLSDKVYSTRTTPRERSPHKMQSLLKEFKKSTHREIEKTGYFTGNIRKIRNKYQAVFITLLVISIFSGPFLGGIMAGFGSFGPFRYAMLTFSLGIISVVGIIVGYHMPAVTKQGAQQKWQWLCFKEYLKTAERYRLEAETPETFSLFLPYAIILKAEKEWIKKFEPTFAKEGWNEDWYIPSSAMAPAQIAGTQTGPGPSVAGFSSSFSAFTTSFSRSFTSSSSSGVSGGGGSSGGGGGGGGGGAG